MSGAALVSLRGVFVRLKDRVVPLPDLDVLPGARIAVVGPNGAGKTTLLRAIAGLSEADGVLTRETALGEIAIVAARPFLLAGNVLFNVGLPLRVRGVPSVERNARALDALAALGSADLARRDRRELSDGQAQRVALARAFVASPRVLLLDEPLASLDDLGRSLLAGMLVALHDVAVVVAAPTVNDAPSSCRTTIVQM